LNEAPSCQLAHVSPERFAQACGFVCRYGPLAVFVARFLTGLGILAGPLAGSIGMHPRPFLLANVAGASGCANLVAIREFART
jgi:membrane protein DedA with SNARE-associated domain